MVQSSNGVNTNMAGTALPSTVAAGAALPLTPSTIQSIVVPLSVQDYPVLLGHLVCRSFACRRSLEQLPHAAGLLNNMPLAAMQPTATQPAAMNLLGTPSIMSVRPNQMVLLPLLMHRALSSLTCQTPVGSFLRGSKCYKISFFKSGNSLRLEKLIMLSFMYLRHRFPQLFSSGPTVSEKVDDDVEVISVRSASAKRARPRDQATTCLSKHARSSASTSHRSLSPRRDYPRGTSTVTRPYLRPVLGETQGQTCTCPGLRSFKADMTSMLADMLKSSLSNFASQLKSSSGGQGES